MYLGDREYFLKRILNIDEAGLAAVESQVAESYHLFKIPKKGGYRSIRAINRGSPLYAVQKALCYNFLDKVSLPVPAVGFVKGESYLKFLKPHVGKRFFMRLDIHDFFGSITGNMLRAGLSDFFPREGSKNLEDLIELCTLNDSLPQGAVTSPALSNLVFRRTDQRILKYCQSFEVLYRQGERLSEDIHFTRYADDMLFSSDHLDFSKEPYFAGMVSNILISSGFKLNREKTKYGDGEISLSGFVVTGKNIHLSRGKLYPLNKLLHFCGKNQEYTGQKYRVRKSLFQEPDWLRQINGLGLTGGERGTKYFNNADELLDYMCGYRALLLSVLDINDQMDKDMEQLEVKIRKLEMVIDQILSQADMI